MRPRLHITALLGLLLGSTLALHAQSDADVAGRVYTDTRGVRVYLPLGRLSFADRVIRYVPGQPDGGPLYSIQEEALGEPDFIAHGDILSNSHCLTLGCGGHVVLQFVDNVLIDRSGPDLYIFEVGMSIEPTNVEISVNGEDWIDVGQAPGGTAAIDIGPHVEPNQHFRFVRITDLRSDCRGTPPGADIDAVAAIGSGILFSDSLAVFFDHDRATIGPQQRRVLTTVATKLRHYPGAEITLLGHTDTAGTDAYNVDLALRRAMAVRDYLVRVEGLDHAHIGVIAFGRRKPIATNDTEFGRSLNRRVEIIVVPIADPR